MKCRLFSGILVLLFMFSLTACTVEKIPVEKAIVLEVQESFPPVPRLVGTGEGVDLANENLYQILDGLFNALTNLHQREIGAPVISYHLRGEKPNFLLEVQIATEQQEMDKLVLNVDVDSGEVFFQDQGIRQAISDANFMYRVLYHGMQGLKLPFKDYQQSITIGRWIELLVQAYEELAGQEIDVTDIIDMGTTAQRKGLALDLISVHNIQEGEQNILDAPVSDSYAIDTIITWYKKVNEELYGRCIQKADVRDAWDIFALYSQLADMDLAGEEVKGRIESIMNMDQPLTRLALAKFLVAIEEYHQGREISYDKSYWHPMEDTKDNDAQKADAVGLMSRYYDKNLFYPEKQLQLQEIYRPIAALVQRAYWYNDQEPQPHSVSLDQALEMVEILQNSLSSYTVQHYEEKRVLNERSYDWYVNQANTGKYSYVNCMPSCMEMVLRWRDESNKVTAEQLRNEYPADGQGWFDIGLANMLERYQVPFELEWDSSLEAMLAHLDMGKVLIVMYNDGTSEMGHAIVVKGYRETSAGVWLICNDPSSFMDVGKYGVSDGIGREKEAGELLWQMERHSKWYLVISQ